MVFKWSADASSNGLQMVCKWSLKNGLQMVFKWSSGGLQTGLHMIFKCLQIVFKRVFAWSSNVLQMLGKWISNGLHERSSNGLQMDFKSLQMVFQCPLNGLPIVFKRFSDASSHGFQMVLTGSF